jgi:16S rRNA processing protein RimM
VPTDRPDGLLEVGHVARPHGIRGDVWVALSTDRTERVAPGARLWGAGRWWTVTSSSAAGDRWRVRFEGIADRAGAEALARTALYAEPIDDPDALWVHELIGAAVVEVGGTPRGRCVAVLANPAADLLELESGALVPITFVVSAGDGVITIDPPDGLFELFDLVGDGA